MNKLIIIGWDGATWDLLAPWAEAGLLPNVARLRREGAYGPLRSTIQPLTAVAWSSFLTGCQPGKHGLYDFVGRVPGRYDVRLTGRDQRQVPDLWHYLNQAGHPIIAVNVPMMVPVTPVNGIVVGGIDAPGLSPQTVYPAGFITELQATLPHYCIAPSERSLPNWEKALHAAITGRGQLLHHLQTNHPWDCLMVVFSATDIGQHVFFGHHLRQAAPYAATLLRLYQQCDTILGQLLDNLDGDTSLILMSDHGAGPLAGAIHINRYLEAGGFLRQVPAGDWGLARLLRWGKRYLPAGARAYLRRRLGNVRDRVESQLVANAYDWDHTAAYSLGSYGNIYFNVRGREPQGIVDPAGIDDLAAHLTTHLLALRAPGSNEPLVKRVWRREELYQGPAVDRAPDLIIEWANLAYEVRARFGAGGQAIFAPTMPLNDLAPETLLTGTHRMDGILAAIGPHVQPGPIANAHITDLAPTILHRFARPVPQHMDGRILPELSAGLGQATYMVDEALGLAGTPAGLNNQDAAAIEERLRSLGYLG